MLDVIFNIPREYLIEIIIILAFIVIEEFLSKLTNKIKDDHKRKLLNKIDKIFCLLFIVVIVVYTRIVNEI